MLVPLEVSDLSLAHVWLSSSDMSKPAGVTQLVARAASNSLRRRQSFRHADNRLGLPAPPAHAVVVLASEHVPALLPSVAPTAVAAARTTSRGASLRASSNQPFKGALGAQAQRAAQKLIAKTPHQSNRAKDVSGDQITMPTTKQHVVPAKRTSQLQARVRRLHSFAGPSTVSSRSFCIKGIKQGQAGREIQS